MYSLHMDIYRESKLMKNSKGFTLIELIIVVVLIGLMSAIAIPNFINWLPNYRLKAATRQLYGAAMKAKGEAVKRNVNCALSFNQTIGGVANVYVVYVDDNSNCQFDTGETIITQVTDWPKQVSFDTSKGGGDGLSFSNNSTGQPTIAFMPNVIPTACGSVPNGTAFLTNTKGSQHQVVINRAGSIRID